jgi:hypothetical protein
MFFTPRALRIPSVKSVLIPRTARRKANLIPSGRSVAAKGGRTARRTITGTRKRTTR